MVMGSEGGTQMHSVKKMDSEWIENRIARMQHEECNEMISSQDTSAKDGVTGQCGNRDY